MSIETSLTRRALFTKIGILFNGLVAAALSVPIARFLLSSITRGQANSYLSWVSLGPVSQFPEGETRLATFRNPYVMPTDGQTADTACWVRRIEANRFQVFAVNCAHLGCPVRWFPQSGLFMCPDRRSVGYSSIRTRFGTGNSRFAPASCRHQGRMPLASRVSRHARDSSRRRMVRPPSATGGADP